MPQGGSTWLTAQAQLLAPVCKLRSVPSVPASDALSLCTCDAFVLGLCCEDQVERKPTHLGRARQSRDCKGRSVLGSQEPTRGNVKAFPPTLKCTACQLLLFLGDNSGAFCSRQNTPFPCPAGLCHCLSTDVWLGCPNVLP